MTNQTERLRLKADAVEAMGHAPGLGAIELPKDGEKCDIVSHLGTGISYISWHLAVLKGTVS